MEVLLSFEMSLMLADQLVAHHLPALGMIRNILSH